MHGTRRVHCGSGSVTSSRKRTFLLRARRNASCLQVYAPISLSGTLKESSNSEVVEIRSKGQSFGIYVDDFVHWRRLHGLTFAQNNAVVRFQTDTTVPV